MKLGIVEGKRGAMRTKEGLFQGPRPKKVMTGSSGGQRRGRVVDRCEMYLGDSTGRSW